MSDVFFGVQVAIKAPPGDGWRRHFTALVREHLRDLSLADKRGLYGSVANLLVGNAERVSLGFWDFVPNGTAEYDEWTRGIEDDSAELWQPDRSGASMDHVLVSAMFLMPADGASAELVGERCDLPEETWRDRASYRHLFETMSRLNFASVRSDALFVTPGGDESAFSLRELQGEGYEYLIPVR